MIQVNTKRVLLGIFTVLIPMIAISTAVYLFLDSRAVKGISVKREIESFAPYISNMPPNVVSVGEEYIFIPKIVAEDITLVSITMEEGPAWLHIDESNIVRGIPSEEDVGVGKMVLKVSDGYNSSTLVEYLLVKENEEVGGINN